MPRAAKAKSGKAAKAAPTKKGGGRKAVKKAVKRAPKAVAAAPVERKSAADLRLETFVAAYFASNLNATKAAVLAGFSPDSARAIGSQLLARDDVQSMIQKRQSEVIGVLGLNQEWVLGRLKGIAQADPREISELHIDSCRFCWGEDNNYQFTRREMAEHRREWEKREAEKQLTEPPGEPEAFDPKGGIGFNPNRPPNPQCEECHGRGVRTPVYGDSRDLSPEARLLFQGVKQTLNGFEVKTHNPVEAVLNIGKHLGMFANKHHVSAPDGGPVKHTMNSILEEIGADGGDTGIGPSTG